MRAAQEEYLEEYCIEVLNSQSEEELQVIKQEIIETLKEVNYSDDAIQYFFATADKMLEDEMILEESQELEAIQEVPSTNYSQNLIAGGVGLGLTALIVSLALKQKNLKNNKQIKK